MKLAVVTTHPVQYYAPWFWTMANDPRLEVMVYYLSRHGLEEGHDLEFRQTVRWDFDILGGYEKTFVPNASPWDSPQQWKGIWNPTLLETFRHDRPDAILLMGYNYPTIWNLLIHASSLPPLLLKGDSHRLVARTGIVRKLKDQLIRHMFRRVRAFLYVGGANYDYFRTYGAPKERLFYSPHAIDLGHFQADESVELRAQALRQEWGIPDRAPLILFAGKWIEKKRPLDLLRAFGIAGLSDAHLVYVGGGELEEALKENSRILPRVHIVGFKNQSEMPAVYRAADLFVLPSCGPDETWGLAVQEAMAMETPVMVSTQVGCAADLVDPGMTGWIFPADDVDALADAIRKAVTQCDLEMVGKAARTKVETRTYERATDGLLEALQAVCPSV